MSNKYPTITPQERGALIVMGWLFNPQVDIWMFAPGDLPFSECQSDHDIKFHDDLRALRGGTLAASPAGERDFGPEGPQGTAPYITD